MTLAIFAVGIALAIAAGCWAARDVVRDVGILLDNDDARREAAE